ncbi:MAG: hypothetical protein H6851_09540 [Geminicoccaceae bacterium]|nr:hypothetical protein [Geminicoccaceae bacterium]MCB9943847.1 hypothetical protein [Geminicoccaceae bacterium]
MMRDIALAMLLAAAPALFRPVHAQTLDDYVGAFVGEAVVSDPLTGQTSLRDMDIVFSRPARTDLHIEWVNVDLVDGRRNLPGVKRRTGALDLEKSGNGGYLRERRAYNPFKERDEIAPIAGDPVRWGYLDAEGLRVFSFVILDDGRYELQTHVRSLEGDRLNLEFERIVDGVVERTIEGRAQRAD